MNICETQREPWRKSERTKTGIQVAREILLEEAPQIVLQSQFGIENAGARSEPLWFKVNKNVFHTELSEILIWQRIYRK